MITTYMHKHLFIDSLPNEPTYIFIFIKMTNFDILEV